MIMKQDNYFFSLPHDIIRYIYEFDSTFKNDKIISRLTYELWYASTKRKIPMMKELVKSALYLENIKNIVISFDIINPNMIYFKMTYGRKNELSGTMNIELIGIICSKRLNHEFYTRRYNWSNYIIEPPSYSSELTNNIKIKLHEHSYLCSVKNTFSDLKCFNLDKNDELNDYYLWYRNET